ncbi:MAG: FkbM family methyltransferase [Hyphomonadaceae bacterium]|nr:FkbM family methyltransferase [Hyphomonadaceae bacterium]
MGDASIEILDNIEFPSSPKLLKIDVEGMDFGVLQGAKKTIEAARPVVAVEAADRGQYDQIAAFLEELGYVHAESYNYTPTHIFVVSAARTTSAVKQIAREMGRNYIETSTVRSLSDSRFSHMNGKLVALEQAQAATTMADKEGREAIAAVSGALDKVRDEHADRIKMVARSLDAERAQTSERLHQQEVSIETIQAAVSNFGDRWLIALEQIEAGAAAQSGRLDRHQLEIAEAMRANAKADSEKWSALRDAIRERDTEGRERLAALCERLEKVLWAQTGDSAAKRDAALAGLERRLTEIEAAREAGSDC